ncbi:hypothetical protein niasHS_006133 [Heterodera schachtii]|uniref:Uncharacterized protein n=1 Tax=Heterodera schachtii TaxID=97005 RepID=A0ABD2JWQ0_HETSC
MLFFFPNLLFLFIFFSVLLFGSVEPNNGHVAFVWGRRETATTDVLDEKIAEGYELVSMVEDDGRYANRFLWTLVKKNDDNKNNQQIDALGQKLDTLIEKIDQDRTEQQKTGDTLLEQTKTLNGKLDTLVTAINTLVEQLEKKSVKVTLW